VGLTGRIDEIGLIGLTGLTDPMHLMLAVICICYRQQMRGRKESDQNLLPYPVLCIDAKLKGSAKYEGKETLCSQERR
jgi:hypothetical protein